MLGQHQLVLSKCLPLFPITVLQIRLYPTLHSIITFRAGWEGDPYHYSCSYIHVFILCLWGCGHTCQGKGVKVRGLFAGIGSLLPLFGSQGLSSGYQFYGKCLYRCVIDLRIIIAIEETVQ